MKWIRPSGSIIETNDNKATIEHCVQLGWKHQEENIKPKRTRRTKEQIEADKAKS